MVRWSFARCEVTGTKSAPKRALLTQTRTENLPPVLRALYYQLKPWLPWRLRMALRRDWARRRRMRFADNWPICPGAAQPPQDWRGWPEGKKFALVLTHDVEGATGLGRCHPLMDLESALGFRSCFNFVPEGEYAVAKEFREQTTERGFEIGVHDLKHDGKLYRYRWAFRLHAQKINRYLREWGAVGFRSAYMLHELSWLHDLNIRYDASTFDTDPFEPQPEGVHTVFPFWVAGPPGRGYVELPYTLPQDSTLFVVLRESGPEIWKRKLDWIAQHGGMALLDTHPDYMSFGKELGTDREYPVGWYREFLEYVASRYEGQFWHALPREVASYMNAMVKPKIAQPPQIEILSRDAVPERPSRKIWVDLDNTPHVPFFLPIIADLKSRGYEVLVTARDAFQVCDLADFHHLNYQKVGRHHGKNKLAKVAGLFYRALQLLPFVLRHRPALGVSHGSRSQIIACNLLGIPTILVADYEHARTPPLMRPKWELAPEAIPTEVLHCRNGHVRKYPGIKEDVYAWTLSPDSSVLKELAIEKEHLVVLVRPPATEAHYHNPESERLFERAMNRLREQPEVRIILLPRNRRQEEWVQFRWPQWFERPGVVIPKRALDGLNLIWHADLVISGGGTMNRESAALGVPVYSIFRGPTGAVDRHLQAEGRLVLITSLDEVDTKIVIRKRDKLAQPDARPRPALRHIVEQIESILETESGSAPGLAPSADIGKSK